MIIKEVVKVYTTILPGNSKLDVNIESKDSQKTRKKD